MIPDYFQNLLLHTQFSVTITTTLNSNQILVTLAVIHIKVELRVA